MNTAFSGMGCWWYKEEGNHWDWGAWYSSLGRDYNNIENSGGKAWHVLDTDAEIDTGAQ